ncbi:MAG: SLC13 family permease, partial [Bacteroidota bacterium]
IRESHKFYPGPNAVFFAGDVVLVTGNIKDLLAVKDKNGIDILADVLEKFYSNDNKDPLQLREVLIPANSTLTGKSVKSADFRRRYGLAVVAINRASETLTDKIGSIELQVGDVLLVQGTADRLADFHDEHNLILMGEHEVNPNRVRKGWLAIGIFLVAVVLSSFKIIPTDIAFLGAALSTVVFRIIKPGEVYGNIDWRLLVLIGGMSAFGTAMKNSGADVFISDFFISIFKGLGPGGIMLGFMIITVLLTQPMSNAAAALVVLPIALQSAESLQVNPVTFGVAVMLSASVSVMTPFEPSCILIYSPGKYRFADFMRVGGGLTLILVVAIYFLVPMFWTLQ